MALAKRKRDIIFTYQTKCLVNGKTYIGYHSTTDINDGYIGCGINSQAKARSMAKYGLKSPLISAVLKYGYENFVMVPLCFFDTIEEAIEEEKYLVTIDYVAKIDNYNAAIGGSGGMPFSVDDNTCSLIINDFMGGMKKSDVMKKYGISNSVMYKITKRYEIKNRPNALSDKSISIQKWISENADRYIDLYKRGIMSKEQINSEIPFFLWRNDFLKGIKRNSRLYFIKESCIVPINSSRDIEMHTGLIKPRISEAVKYTLAGKKYRGYSFTTFV